MSEFIDGKISTLARQLEPYVRKWVRDILGGQAGGREDGLTWIQGTGFPKDDEQENRGRSTVSTIGGPGYGYADFQLNRVSEDQVVMGDDASILGGQNNKTMWRIDAVVGGKGAFVSGDIAWAMGNQFEALGDGQSNWIQTFGEEYYYPEEYFDEPGQWAPLFDYELWDMPDNHTFLLNAYFVGHDVIGGNAGGNKCWHFTLDALLTYSPLAIIWQKSTEIYSDGDGVDVRVGTEYGLTFQAYSACYQGIRWHCTSRMVEVTF